MEDRVTFRRLFKIATIDVELREDGDTETT